MATSTAGGYGTYNPREDQPYSIESVLAKIVGENNPAEAANMLDTYQVQRQTAQGNYDYAMQGQHDFAKQQLAQQLYEANLKGLAEAKDPTVLQLMAGNPTYSSVLGSNQANIGDALKRAQDAVAAKSFGEAGKGAEGFSNAGYMVDKGSLPGLPPNADVTQTENVRLAQERLRSQTALATAAMRGQKEAMGTLSGQTPMNAAGDAYTYSRKVADKDVAAEIARRDAINANIRAGRSGDGNTTGGPGVGGGSGSTLPPAKTDTPANRPGGSTQLDTNSPNGRMAQGGATIAVDRASRSGDPRGVAMAADVKAGMRSATVYDTHMGADGKPYVRGKSGNFYPIQN